MNRENHSNRVGAYGLLLLLAVVFGLGQELTHSVSVVNISVPVRVYDGNKFVDSLKLEDFEVYEDGKLQPVQAVYFIQKNDVKRGEAPARSAAPATARHFVLLFEMNEFLPEVDTAIDYFFDNVFLRGDTLDVVTIRTTYRLREDVSSKALREKTKNELKSKIRQDTVIAGGDINSIVQELIANLEADDLDAYETNLQHLESMRAVDEKRMVAFARNLRGHSGSKHVFLFFQRELIPQYSAKRLTELLMTAGLEVQFKLMSLMTHFSRDMIIDKKAVEKAFSDASVDIHFLFITKSARDISLDGTNQNAINNTKMEEHSEDIFKAFSEIASVTGGIVDTSANIASLMKTAVQASERYYLLYYRPRNYSDDGQFHEITVKVKNRNYRISHRAGYFAKDVPVEPPPSPEAAKPAPLPETKPAEPKNEARAAEVASLLEKSAAYCRKLENAALNFVCYEYVSEQIFLPKSVVNESSSDVTLFNPGTQGNARRPRAREWAYDYQLIRTGGQTREKRALLMEDGEKRREENVELRPTRFIHKNLVIGPIGLFGAAAQALHSYTFVKEGKVDDEPALVVEATPQKKTAASIYGKAWLRKKDGAVLRIEWEPTSIDEYEKIVQFSVKIGYRPKLVFLSEYGFEKNGLRFPNSYEVIESYVGLATTWGNVFSKTTVTYKDYKFFQVETAVEIR